MGEELEPTFGEAKLFRPYRDVRFSKDKSLIKDHQGMFVLKANSVGWHLQVSDAGLMVAGGWYESDPRQIAAYRAAVEADAAADLDAPTGLLTELGGTIAGDRVKTRPRGVPLNHPQLN